MIKNDLYLECYSGISGDMTVAALLDLGADVDVLMAGLNSLNVDGYKIEISRKAKNSIDACDFHVILDVPETDYRVLDTPGKDTGIDSPHVHKEGPVLKEAVTSKSSVIKGKPSVKRIASAKASHSHTHESGEHALIHGHGHTHVHEDGHGHFHIHYGHHDHRNLQDIYTIIDHSGISAHAKEIAKKIFYIVAAAESKAHGKSIEEVHFHEVGAVDSIVDIVAVAICLDHLKIGNVYVSELYEGTGHINCQHGVLPVPVPAVVNIAAAHGLHLHLTNIKGELVTPTGAAIVAAIKTHDTLPKEFSIQKIGLGLGKRNYERASFLRAMLIKDLSDNSSPSALPDKVWVLEANIDDCSGEALSLAMEILFKNGAKDVYYTPIYMKKNRPAYLLGVICSEDKIEKLEEIIFTHTTTIGIRKQESLRTTLERSQKTVTTPYGDALVKVCSFGERTYYYPEYESVKKLCIESDMDYNTVYSLVQTLAAK